MLRTAQTDFFARRGKPLAIAGSALALTGAGAGTAAAATTPGTSHVATVVQHAQAGDTARLSWPAASGWTPAEGLLTTRPANALAGARVSAHARARVRVVKRTHRPTTWRQIQDMVARQTFPRATAGQLPAADRLKSGPTSGPQAYLPITADRMANAKTIVRQALTRHMGLRSAVIAVATAMQESTLQNISYGDRDSEGLFQQRPSAGWGSPAQITNPVYASDAFLNALHGHQQADSGWARQPLWENAQAVQNSGFPYAYAKWESQAAQLVSAIARHMF